MCGIRQHLERNYSVDYCFNNNSTLMLTLLQDSEKFWPGLASSETVYAWVLMAYSIPETSSMPFAGIMAEKMPYTVMLLITCALYATGGVFYGQAAGVWMVMVGRAFMGIGAAFADVTVSSYIGEMGTRMDEIRHSRGKKPRKYTLYVAYSFTMNCTFMLTFGECVHHCILVFVLTFQK